MSLLLFEDGSATLDQDRHALCMYALREIKFMAAELPKLVPDDGQSDCKPDTVRSVAGRIMQLSKVLADAIDSPLVGTHELKCLVTIPSHRRLRD
jgi:hypothetical protein